MRLRRIPLRARDTASSRGGSPRLHGYSVRRPQRECCFEMSRSRLDFLRMRDKRRESESDGCSTPRRTRNTDESAMVLHDPVRDGEAKSRTTWFGRVEGIEQPRHGLLRYADAG